MVHNLFCHQLYDELKKQFPQNPYWEKWGRGRPSKAQIEKRKLYWKWQQENGTRGGFLKSCGLSIRPEHNQITYPKRAEHEA